ncbi:MAG: hypothetical protein IJB33_05905 [Akkermansia sp.]|nr:hypothetical protein [Akkermansia sp.]
MKLPTTLLTSTTVLLLTACSRGPLIELSPEAAQQVCESTIRTPGSPSWDELYEIQGVYAFDFVSPDDELDHGTPDIYVLAPQSHGEHHYGVTVFHIFQGHHLDDPSMSCDVNCELNNGVITVPERPAKNIAGKKGPYTISFKRNEQGNISGFVLKDEEVNIHYRKEIGRRDFR